MTIYTMDELANTFKVSKSTIERAITGGYLSGARIGNKTRFTQEQVNEYLQLRTPTLTDVHKMKRERKKRRNQKLIELSKTQSN